MEKQTKQRGCLADRYLLPKALKKTAKYTDEDFEQVRYLHKNGTSIHTIAKELEMSRRTIQFVLYPERKELAKKQLAERQKDGRYRYSTEKQTAMVREVRQRKRAILDQLIKKN